MKKTILIPLALIATTLLIWYACEKEMEEPPAGQSNKIVFKEIAVNSVSYRQATLTYNVDNLDKNDINFFGICYNSSGEPTKEDNTVSLTKSSSGAQTIEGLSPDTKYHFRLYVEIGDEAVYSNDENFSTNPLGTPFISTHEISDITATSAVCGGDVTKKNGSDVTAKGVCWNKSGSPKTSDNKTDEGGGLGEFSSNLENLDVNTTYSVRAYATNEAGTAYGQELSFTTEDGLPELTTNEVTAIDATSATTGGNITDNGGFSVTARGVCWSTSQNPTTNDNHTLDGNGTGSFTSNLENLDVNTTYYLRAYATNEAGTVYGQELSFTTEDGLPEITTSEVTAIDTTSATTGGNITDNGGFSVTGRGVCWSTSSNPTISDNHTTDGSGTGSFTSEMTGLTEGTTYYIRAYATNNVGTAYGDQVSFTTTTKVVEVTNPATGKTWMDRNLGANRAATGSADEEAYGDLYQWGRASDGHEKRNSGTTSTLSNSDTPGHGDFITVGSDPYDWRSPQNDNLWQGVNGTNNPCPDGYRLPTAAEWDAERQSWSSNDAAGAFASPLKLPVSGFRYYSNGSLSNVGSNGYYWSSTVDGTYSRILYFYSSNAGMSRYSRANGNSVRCLKD